MHLVRGRPHRGLAGIIGEYADFAERTSGPRETRELPGPGVVVIVDLDAGWSVEGTRFSSFAGGHGRPVRVRHEGSSRGVQFNVEPPATRALLGVPAGEFAHRTVALEDILGVEVAAMAERLNDAPNAGARFEILDEVLVRMLARARPTRPDVDWAWRLLRASGGQMRIEALAAGVGCSRRHLVKRFTEDVGVPPKLAARLIRFETARRELGTLPLARLAATHGFADQAHLAREFRALGGASPTAFPFVQDTPAASA